VDLDEQGAMCVNPGREILQGIAVFSVCSVHVGACMWQFTPRCTDTQTRAFCVKMLLWALGAWVVHLRI